MFAYPQNIEVWAAFLNNNKDWKAALNSAFDDIGFSEDYISNLGKAANGRGFKAVKDDVWGMVQLDPLASWILDSPLLQRLRFIRQLGFSYLTYPGAQHTRFEHTIGVYYVVRRLLESFRNTHLLDQGRKNWDALTVRAVAYPDGDEEELLISTAALVHDVGHSVFSHVSEDYFRDRAGSLKVGPFSIIDFSNDFFAHYYGLVEGTTRITETREKKLSEMLAVAIVTSERFVKFLEASPGFPKEIKHKPLKATEAVVKIGCLILGDPIANDDFALPQILSGPFDADKIDYMLRDAQGCGIALSLDVSRLFFRAGVYEVRNAQMVDKLIRKKFDDGVLPKRVFTLDQSGSDAIREMGMARLSLYGRVYQHQLTLNAEAHFCETMDAAAMEEEALPFTQDLLKAWVLSDDAALYLLGRKRPSIGYKMARDLLERRFLKRSACIGAELFDHQMQVAKDFEPLEIILRDLIVPQAVLHLNEKLGKPESNRALCSRITEQCAQIKASLVAKGYRKEDLPPEDAPEFIRLLKAPKPTDVVLPQANVLSPSRKVYLESARQSSYYDAGRIPEKRAYLFLPSAWRAIGLLALQKVIFLESITAVEQRIDLDAPKSLEAGTPDEEEEGFFVGWRPKLRIHYRPILDAESSAHIARVDWSVCEKMQGYLGAYYTDTPWLVRFKDNAALQRVAERFKEFSGQHGWDFRGLGKQPNDVIRSFIEQFPSPLRDNAISMLESIEVLGMSKTARLVQEAVTKLPEYRKVTMHLVGLSPSSGSLIRNYLKAELEDKDLKQIVLQSSLMDALHAIKDDEVIVFVDDNIASGIQATRQISIWLGETPGKLSEGNYFRAPLGENYNKTFRAIPIRFAFALGNSEGEKPGIPVLLDYMKKSSLNCGDVQHIKYAHPLGEWSGRKGSPKEINAGLRDFLREVGRGVYVDGHPTEKNPDSKALGYDNLEGLCITAFNVPTSTYTALWYAGFYDSAGTKRPWRPLFPRIGTIDRLVLF